MSNLFLMLNYPINRQSPVTPWQHIRNRSIVYCQSFSVVPLEWVLRELCSTTYMQKEDESFDGNWRKKKPFSGGKEFDMISEGCRKALCSSASCSSYHDCPIKSKYFILPPSVNAASFLRKDCSGGTTEEEQNLPKSISWTLGRRRLCLHVRYWF